MSKRAKAPEEAANHERWLITYADLVTLLFALFIVLFANSDIDEGKFGPTREAFQRAFNVGIFSGGQEEPELVNGPPIQLTLGQAAKVDYTVLSQEITAVAVELGLQDRVTIRLTENSVTISLANNLLFAPADARIDAEAAGLLDRLAETLRALPNQIRVEGHTDSIPVNSGAHATNWELSTARATAVLRYFAEQAGVNPSRLYAAGFADQQPVAENTTPEGRAKNRRADIVILYPNSVPAESGIDLDLAAERAAQDETAGEAAVDDPAITDEAAPAADEE